MEADKKNENNQTGEQKDNAAGGSVCVFWLKGNCKNGDNCEFLHEKISEKLPECPQGIFCTKINVGCPFKHTLKLKKENEVIYFCLNNLQCYLCKKPLNEACNNCQIEGESLVTCKKVVGACNDIFHAHCIDKWIRNQNKCPICSKEWIQVYFSN